MIRKLFLSAVFVAVLFLGWTHSAGAYDYGLQILDPQRIQKLSDQALTQAYIDAVIEVEAAKIFHIKVGFTPKDYREFKDLIRYRVNLLFELKRRKLEIPQIEASQKGNNDGQDNAGS